MRKIQYESVKRINIVYIENYSLGVVPYDSMTTSENEVTSQELNTI